MSKRMFQILDEMNVADGENKTDNVAVSGHLVRADKAKGGAHIVMGVEEKYLYDILADNNKAVILLIINKKEYDKIKSQP